MSMDFKTRLKELGLTWMSENAELLLASAKEGRMSHADLLARLVEGERAARSERAAKRRLQAAKVPVRKSLADFNWQWPRKIDQDLVRDVFRLGFLNGHGNVVFMGGVGLGKTHLASALAVEACSRNIPTLFATAVGIVNHLQTAQAKGCLEKALKLYTAPRLLCCDEFGYLPIDQQGAHLLFQVVAGRNEKGSTVITTNRPYKDWAATLANDAALTSAILDRLAGNCQTVVIEGASYRMREKAGR
jgi:DNA replication protein DnaC